MVIDLNSQQCHWSCNERDGVSKTPASRLFTQPFIKENIKAPRHWPFEGASGWQEKSPNNRSVTQKMFLFDDIIMNKRILQVGNMSRKTYTFRTRYDLSGTTKQSSIPMLDCAINCTDKCSEILHRWKMMFYNDTHLSPIAYLVAWD